MNNQQGLQSLNHSISGLPQWVSERILQQINQLPHFRFIQQSLLTFVPADSPPE